MAKTPADPPPVIASDDPAGAPPTSRASGPGASGLRASGLRAEGLALRRNWRQGLRSAWNAIGEKIRRGSSRRPVTTLALCLVTAIALSLCFPPNLAPTNASIAIEAADGSLLRAFPAPDAQIRLPITSDAVDPNFLRLLIAFEDKRFYRHWGVDPQAMARAILQNIRGRRVISGGSTLTMQAARLLAPSNRNILSKLLEAHRALRLEIFLSKKQILDLYLRLAPYGGNIAGLRTASLQWLGKEPAHLTLAESALLIALPQSPNRARPDRDNRQAKILRDKVLRVLFTRGAITQEDAEQAQAEPLPSLRQKLPFLAPHLSERLARTLPRDQARIVTTTLDARLQARIETLIARALPELDPKASLAVMVVDSQTGELRAHIGSADYFDVQRQGNVDMTRAIRSPGSTLKPFIYGMAFDDGLGLPNTIIRDAPTRFGTYQPSNFEGGYAGEVTLRQALQQSLNIPAVKLLDQVGPERFAAKLREAGARLVWPDPGARAGLPLALGGVGVTLDDLVQLFMALDHGGQAPKLRVQALPKSAKTEDAKPLTAIMSNAAATAIRQILSQAPPPPGVAADPDGRGFAFKTGTSYGFRDAWAVGSGGGWTVGVLVARPDATPIAEQFGRASAAPILFRIFNILPSRPTQIAPDYTLLEKERAADSAKLWRGDRTEPGQRGNPLRILHPDAGSVVDLASLEGALTLIGQGGTRPYHWLVNGLPLDSEAWRDAVDWTPDGPGAVSVTLVDADGRSAIADIWLR